MLGQSGDIAFGYSAQRGAQAVKAFLGEAYTGTIQTDGYQVYADYAARLPGCIHALCWFVQTHRNESGPVVEKFFAWVLDLETNDLERALRVIPMGRKNWLFCSSETGAQQLSTIQTMLATCRRHGVGPYAYLVDVLQRINTLPASRVAELTPRERAGRFAHAPLRSDLASTSQ